MNTMFRAGLLAVAFLFFAGSLTAQSTPAADLLQKADKQYDLYAYNLALRTYEQVLKQEPNNAHAIARMADCYFQLNRPEESLEWYNRAVNLQQTEPTVPLHYGLALMQTGDYVGAKKWFVLYQQTDPTVGRHYAEMCDYALATAGQEPAYNARNEGINTDAADYGPAFLGNRVVYSSARTDIVRKTQSRTSSDWSGSAFNQLFVTQRSPDNGFLLRPTFLRSDLQNSYNVGPVSFSADGRRVAFCKNNFIDGTRQIASRGLNMSLYVADVDDDGSWLNERAFPYNGSDYSTGFPGLSADGRTLYFASNQPNGYGGWDVYVSYWTGTDWTVPQNLGQPLNTPGNEITPYVDGSNFYFASDWHPGLGGMDVFRADLQGGQRASNIYHLGPGINSSRDDYGLIFSTSQNLGYLTSNRLDGRGNEDIWMVSAPVAATPPTAATPPPTTTPIVANTSLPAETPATYSTPTSYPSSTLAPAPTTASASDRQPVTYSTSTAALPASMPVEDSEAMFYVLVTNLEGLPLAGAEVDLSRCGGKTGTTDRDGKYYFNARMRAVDCDVVLRKEGFMETVAPVSAFGRSNIVVQMAADARREYTGTVFDAITKNPLPEVTIRYALSSNGRSFEALTDLQGNYRLLLVPKSAYTITYSKKGYQDEIANIRPGMPGTGANLARVMLERTPPAKTTAKTPATAKKPTVDPAGTAPATYSVTPAGAGTTAETGYSGYSIQLAAAPRDVAAANATEYEVLSRYGNVYTRPEAQLNKVRLGVYPTRAEAERNLKEVRKNKDFKGAFIVEEKNADPGLMITVPKTVSRPGATPAESAAQRPATYSTPPSAPEPQSTLSAKGVTPASDNSAVRFAVQIGSFSQTKALNISEFNGLEGLGNVYARSENEMNKVRVGVWASHDEAEAVRDELVRRGYRDAHIVTEKTDDPIIRDFMIGTGAPVQPPAADQKKKPGAGAQITPKGSLDMPQTVAPIVYSTTPDVQEPAATPMMATTATAQPLPNISASTRARLGASMVPPANAQFFIRALTFDDISNFDPAKLRGVKGTIEHWPDGSTDRVVIMLTGYKTLEEAIEDNEKLHGLGFPDSFIQTRDANGKTKRFKY